MLGFREELERRVTFRPSLHAQTRDCSILVGDLDVLGEVDAVGGADLTDGPCLVLGAEDGVGVFGVAGDVFL